MKKELRIINENSQYFITIKKIHEGEFSPLEYPNIKELLKRGKESCFYGVFFDDVPVGSVYLLKGRGFIYVVYITTIKEKRRQGIGTWILTEIKNMYQDHTIIVDVPIDKTNIDTSLNKVNFYLKNGFNNTDIYLKYENIDEISIVYATDYTNQQVLDELLKLANGDSKNYRLTQINKKG